LYLRTGRSIPLPLRVPYHIGQSGRARRAYWPQIYPGRLVLLRAVENPRDPFKRWGGMGAEGLEIHEIPGNHDTMIREPLVQEVAAKLNQVLRRAQAALMVMLLNAHALFSLMPD